MGTVTALSPAHLHELVHESCIQPAVVEARGYRTLEDTQEAREELAEIGFARTQIRDGMFPVLLIPMRGMDGEVRGYQIKPAVPRTRLKEDGTRVFLKYESPLKSPSVVDVPAYTRAALASETTPLWVTEGMKKTDSLVSRNLAAVGLQGVFNWRNRHGVLGDWEEIPIKDRPVVLCFDADAASNRNVQLAMSRAGAWFKSRGASKVHYVVVPGNVDGCDVKGVDDYFAAGGEVAGLHEAATQTPPGATEKDAAFTDAFLVEDLAEALQGRFCWASGLGWLRWTGRTWKEVSDVEPLEAVRQWTSEQFDLACEEQKREPSKNLGPKIQGWRSILNKSRLVALKDLAKGILQRDAAEFDGDPDLLTVLNGTLHLPTGKLLPFDPEHCITKSCDAEYRPGYTHPAWTASLRAVPAELHEWYRDRLGQAITGYPTPDHTLVIGCGTGANGKSTIADTIRRTLGGYGILISDRVLMANADAHPTEMMDLRGARYALLEETPEARHLNVQRLKMTLGTPVIRARHIRQDTVEFLATHSLFINTNYRPTVTETDWGTWRRLALQTFPFTFKKAHEPLEGPWDVRGDASLAYSSNDPDVRAAALTWMAEGARAWYARGRMMLAHPEIVERHTRKWRAEMDLVLGFSDECLKFSPDAFTQTREMLTAFNTWAGERGHRPWNDRTFATRFGDHDTIRGYKVQQGRFSIGGKQQRGWAGVEINKDGRDPFTGELDEPPAPLEPQGGLTYDDFGSVVGPAEYPERLCPCDKVGCTGCQPRTADEQAAADAYHAVTESVPSDAAGEYIRDRLAEQATPVALGFDLETASAKQLFTGGHEGPFVRLPGVIADYDDMALPKPDVLIEELNSADVIYGHNILGFDLLALARHHGADYDALAAKAVDTQAIEYLVDPPLSKGMPEGYYKLDTLAERYGVPGKTHDLAALLRKWGGYDKIPVDDQDYNDYLRGDLAATKAVWERQQERVKDMGLEEYAAREMKVVALQNRVTLNGWAVDVPLLQERAATEDAKRLEAIEIMARDYGVPTHYPDRFKLLPKAEWPEHWRQYPVAQVREQYEMEMLEAEGLAVRIPGAPRKKPWSSDEGKAALVKAFNAAGAPHVPLTPKSGELATSDKALGEKGWYCPERKRVVKGMLHPDAYGHLPGVRAICEVLALATGARAKYAEFLPYVTSEGRVHPEVGGTQGSGRWAYVHPSTSTMGKRGAAAEERAVMIADPGHLLVTSDLSQCDVRTVAALSQDPELIAMLQPDSDDYHEAMAEVYFGDRSRRSDAKPINHGVNYGQGAMAIALRNGLAVEMVQAALRARGDRFQALMEWTERVRAQAEAGQLLDNGFGRLMRANPERAYTQAPALMGQGATRDVMAESMLRLDRISEGRVRPYLRGVIHDELVLSVPEGDVAEWQEMLREAMTWEWRGVPILCDVSEPAFRWSKCK